MKIDGMVAIGRSIGSEPMNEATWRSFIEDTHVKVQEAGGAIYGVAYGEGVWEGREATAFVLFGGAEAKELEAALSFLALTYSQRAIAILVGENRLVEPRLYVTN